MLFRRLLSQPDTVLLFLGTPSLFNLLWGGCVYGNSFRRFPRVIQSPGIGFTPPERLQGTTEWKNAISAVPDGQTSSNLLPPKAHSTTDNNNGDSPGNVALLDK